MQAVGQGLRDPVHDPADHLSLEPEGIDRQANVDGVGDLGDPRARISVLDHPVDGLRRAVDLGHARGVALVLVVDTDSLGGVRRHRLAPVSRLGRRVQHREHAGVSHERAPELVRVLPHRFRDLVHHQLLGDGHLRAVDVAYARGVEHAARRVVDLVQELGDRSEVVGHVRCQREDALRIAEIVALGQVAKRRAQDLAQPVRKVGGGARVALVERHHVASQVGDPYPRGAHRVHSSLAEVVRAVPHQLDWLADRLRDRRRLKRRVGEQMATERPAALGHVRRHARHRESQDPGNRLLEIDRRLHRRPDLGAAGTHVGDRAVRLQRVAGTEIEREALVERLAQGGRHRQLGTDQVGEHVGV